MRITELLRNYLIDYFYFIFFLTIIFYHPGTNLENNNIFDLAWRRLLLLSIYYLHQYLLAYILLCIRF